MLNIYENQKTLNLGGKLLNLETPRIMGVLNATPDSFYGNSRINSVSEAANRAEKMVSEGADILDIGAYSSRPGAEDISEQEELDRLIPVIEAVTSRCPDTPISVDTFRSAVAYAAVRAGAHMINDISGGELDESMFSIVGKLKAPYVLMHMRGNPQNMTTLTEYSAIITEMVDYFSQRIASLHAHGVYDIIIDPGFGFAKTSAQSLHILHHLHEFKLIGLPIITGFSRKSLVYKTLGVTADEALNGTTVLNTIALGNGANILRVHDVLEAKQCITLCQQVV